MSGKTCVTFRTATESDLALVLHFIRALAEHEKLLHEVEATEETLRDSLFVKRQAEVIIAELAGEPAGFALYFQNFSTFVGRACLYLEDLFVDPRFRGKGVGKALLRELARVAVQRGCRRLDWLCLDWNRGSIDFYLSLGAVPMDDWTVYRLTDDALANLADGSV